MLTRAELKEASKRQLSGKWGIVGAAFLILGVISVVLSMIPIVGPIIVCLITGAMILGGAIMILKVVDGEPANISDIFAGFKYFAKSLGLYLWQGLFIFLWSLLLVIPGIIKTIAYSMAFYIMADNPEIGIREALKESQRITDGYKMDLFILGLSFLGWMILASLTFGIGYFWLVPYMQATYANTYRTLKNKQTIEG